MIYLSRMTIGHGQGGGRYDLQIRGGEEVGGGHIFCMSTPKDHWRRPGGRTGGGYDLQVREGGGAGGRPILICLRVE